MEISEHEIKVYKFGRGESYENRVDDLKSILSNHYEFDDTKEETVEVDGVKTTLTVVEPENAGLQRVCVGPVEYKNKKTGFAVLFDEVDPRDVKGEDMEDLSKAIDSKNGMLKEVTGRTAEDRRKQMKREAKD